MATDLVSGEQITFSKGSLQQAVMASCAVPGAVEPLKEGDKILSDGGIICLIPSSVAREEGADIVIAVAVDRDIYSEEEFRTVAGVYHSVKLDTQGWLLYSSFQKKIILINLLPWIEKL